MVKFAVSIWRIDRTRVETPHATLLLVFVVQPLCTYVALFHCVSSLSSNIGALLPCRM